MHAINYLTALKDTFVGLVTTLLDEEESHRIDSDSFRAGFLQAASTKRQWAVYVMKDAGKLNALPFLRQHEGLMPLMEAMAVNESFLDRLLELAVAIVNGDLKNELAEGTSARKSLDDILGQHDGHSSDAEKSVKLKEEESAGHGQDVQESAAGTSAEPATDVQDVQKSAVDNVSLFLSLAQTISRRFHEHEAVLSQIH